MGIQDLRIGNFLLYNGGYVCIYSICNYPNIQYLSAKGKKVDAFEIPIEDFTSILLNEEILIGLGFEKINTHYMMTASNGIKIIITDKFILEVAGCLINDWQITPLHELQNLFFAITKKELLISLPNLK